MAETYCEYCGRKGIAGEQCVNCGAQLPKFARDNSGNLTWTGPVMLAVDLKDAGEQIYHSFMTTMLDNQAWLAPGDKIIFTYTLQLTEK